MTADPGTMLVVDDDRLNRKLLTASLEGQGFNVRTAENGRQALDMLQSTPFDVVLLDLIMPEMDGYQVLAELKKSHTLQHLPVIVISALDEMDSVIRCIEMGATDYLPKPVDPILLRARINSSLSQKRLRDIEREYMSEIEQLAGALKVRNRFIQETFGRYLSDEVVASLLESPVGLELGGERQRVTILISDLRGFSAVAERLQPEQVVTVINNYLGTMADIILAHSGMIDEFIGDSILGLFGTPTPREDDARRAVACAVAMQKGMERVNRVNREQGLPEVEMGIGVNTGDVVVGNIGSTKRAKYGAVGSHMNLTARIESYTVGGQVLISDSTLRAAGPDVLIGASVGVNAKGFADPILAHDLLGIGGPNPIRIDRGDPPESILAHPLRVLFTVLEGKHICVGEQREGQMLRVSVMGGVLSTSANVRPLSDIKMRLFDCESEPIQGEVYAKVLLSEPDPPQCYRIRFTSVPPEVRRFLEESVRGAGASRGA